MLAPIFRMGTVERVCAWCKKSLGLVNGDFDARFPITHGICAPCAKRVLESSAANALNRFLDGLGVPLLLVDDDMKVLHASRGAEHLLGSGRIEGGKSGDAIHCLYASEGCGSTLHCRTCTIRNVALKTYQTGRSYTNVPAYPDVVIDGETRTLSLRISTEKVGDWVVLRIDDLRGRREAEREAAS